MSGKSRVSFKRVFSNSPSLKKKSYHNKKSDQQEDDSHQIEEIYPRPFNKFRNLCFTGAGFMGIYGVGVAQCLRDKAPHLLKGKTSGSSSGSLIAMAVASGMDLQLVRECYLSAADKCQKYLFGALNPAFPLEHVVLTSLLKNLPENAHELCNGKLFLSLTRGSDYGNEVVSEYGSRNELVRAVLCCCYVPFVSWYHPPTYKGIKYVDGGFTNQFPIYGPETMTIGAFSGVCDISPIYVGDDNICFTFMRTRVELNKANFFASVSAMVPPPANVLDEFYHNGYEDAEDYLTRMGQL